MSLQRQLVPVLFGQGIDTKADTKTQVLGSLRRAENVVFETINSFTKRFGYDSIRLKDTLGVTLTSPASLTRFKNELNVFSDNKFYAYSETVGRVVDKGYTYTARPTSAPILQNSYNHESVDSIAVEGINVFVYRNTSLGDVRYSVQDAATGGLLVTDTVIAESASYVRVSNIGNKVFIIYSVGADISYVHFNIFKPLSLSSPAALANDLEVAAPIFDASSTPTKLIVAYNSDVVGSHLKIASITSDAAVGTGIGITGSDAPTAIDVFTDRNERIVVAYSSATELRALVLNFTLTGLLLADTLIETVASVNNITGYDHSQSNYTFYYEISAASSVNHYIKKVTLTLAGAAGTPATFVKGLGLASKVFEHDDNYYVTTAFESTLQSTYFVLDTNGVVVSKISPTVGGGHIDGGTLPRVATPTDDTRAIPTLIKGKNVSENGTFFSLLGILNTELDFDPQNPYASSLLGDTLHVAGGILQMYDGENIVEHGFNYYPETITLGSPTNVGGDLVTGGNYSYQAVYRWTDNFGQEHRSAPSVPLDVTISGEFAPTATWNLTNDITLTTVTTGPTRNADTITLQVVAAAANPTDTVLLAVTGTTDAVTITITPNSGANNGGTPVNLTTAQLAALIQLGTGGVAGTYVVDSINVTTSGAAVAQLSDLRASGGGAQNLVDAGEGDGVIATLANGAINESANIVVPCLRLTQKTSVAVELYRTEDAGETYYLCSDPVTPTFSSTASDTVTINDGLSDASLISRELLYTTGGVLENMAPPAADVVAVHTASNRMFLGGLEDAHAFQYSKIREAGKPVEFNDTLRMVIDPIGGPISAGISMDEKFIMFATDAIFYVAGQGPTNTGEQDNFILPERISIEIGCTEPSSVVLTPEGIMFKSRKGIYLLSRGLTLKYIGSEVQEYNDLEITSAKIVGNRNQVRFTTLTGDCLVYNYFVQKWATFSNHEGLSSEVINNDYYYLRTDGTLFKENPTSFSDNGSGISMLLETGWMSLNGLQGFQRVYKMLILGAYKSAHKLLVSCGYDFNEAWTQSKLIDPNTTFITGSTYGEDSPYGSGSPYGGNGDVYQARFDFKKQKCQAIKIKIEDRQESAGEGLSLSGFTLQVGAKKGTGKVAAARKFGTN